MPRRTHLLAVVVAGTACLAITTVAPAAANTGSQPAASGSAAVPAFYTPPAELPAANGSLIRTEPLRLGLSLPGLDGKTLPGTATRLMYKSTDSGGRPLAVTGAYIEPAAAWKGSGPRPLVAVAPGTMGQGDQCAQSRALENPLSVGDGSISVGYDNLAVYRLLATGAAVVITDYAGLGTPDRVHTYVNRVDQGHAMLDAARTARAVPGASGTAASRVGLFGYSQGGGASASAAELQSTYAPDVPVVGTYAGAPPADLFATMEGIDGSALAGALAWSINGVLQSDPEVKPIVDAHTNTAGKKALANASTMCLGDAIFGLGFAKSTKWTVDGRSLSDISATEPQLQAVLAKQRIGNLSPTGPVRLATGVHDDIVPHGQARQLAVDWCRKGAMVSYKAVVLPNLGDKLLTNHIAPYLADQSAAISWLTDRLEGKPEGTNCWSMPLQP